MPHKIRAAVVALILFAGPNTMSFAEDTKGDGGASNSSAGQGIGNTSSTHNPRPSSSSPTGVENRNQGETGTTTSTHNPPKER
jgi:hypothetical protein